MAERQTKELTDIATYRAAIIAEKIIQLGFNKSYINDTVKNKQNVQYWYVQYKCAFFIKRTISF